MTYTNVFGSATLPPSEYGYASFTLTTNATFVWPYNTDGSSYPVAKVMDIACDTGNEITLPDCTEVSTGEDFLIRNVGANVLIVKDAAGVQVASVAVGAASYFYLTDNTSAAGVFGVIGFGVGTSAVDAASLVGYGIKAVGASLNQSHPVFPTSTGITLGNDHRSKLVVFTGGSDTFYLSAAAALGNDYFTLFRNEGTGTVTIEPNGSETLDGLTSFQVQPSESLMLICTGVQWYSVGYGRSTVYQFTQLTKDVSAGGTITLTAAEASNKMITFVGNPSAPVTVVAPAVVSIYYTYNGISTNQTINFKTASGSGVGLAQGARIIVLCDGTNMLSAQSAIANSIVPLEDGSSTTPSMYFSTQTNTGFYKSGVQDMGITVNGSTSGVFGNTGLQTSTIGANSSQRHTVPAVGSDTLALLAATQTLTNKSVNLANNTLTGTTAQFNAALSDNDFATQAGSETLTNKSVNLANNTLTGTTAQFNAALSDNDFATLAGSETLTNKSINLANNTLTGTLAQFNSALSDGDFAPVNSPAFTGTPSAPTAAPGTNTAQLATTAFATAALQAVYPIGSVYINAAVATNPATLLGFGTWVEFGAGRVLVGQNAADASFDVLGETGGSKDAIVVSHAHNVTGSTGAAGSHNHSISDPGHSHYGMVEGNNGTGSHTVSNVGNQPYYTYPGWVSASGTGIGIDGVGDHAHSVSGATDWQGSSGADANLQPYVVVKMWLRTA